MNDYITLAPARLVDRKKGVFKLPTFSFSFAPTDITMDSTTVTMDSTSFTMDLNSRTGADYSWAGASVIIAQYNFSSTKNFVLEDLPEAPDEANFCLCIRYRVGDTVYRYKLWEGVGEVLNAPLYNGEIIRKNFVLEIWTVENINQAELEAEITLVSSILKLQSLDEDDNDENETYEDAIGVQFLNLLNEETTNDVSGLTAWYRFESSNLTMDDLGYVTALKRYLPDTSVSGSFSGASQLSMAGSLGSYMFPLFGGGKIYNAIFNSALDSNPRSLFFVCASSYTGADSTDIFIQVGNVKISIDDSDNLIVVVNDTATSTLANFSTLGWVLIDVAQTIDSSTVVNATVAFNKLDGTSYQTEQFSIDAAISFYAELRIAETSPVGNIYIGDIILFDTAPEMITPYYNELGRLYGYLAAPLTFNEGVQWLDNE